MAFLTEAVAELYAAGPDTFTARRKDLAAQARRAGDAATAKSIAALARPTTSASLVNGLVWADPSVAGQLRELGDELRASEAALDAAGLRRLSTARRKLVDTLVRQAIGRSGQQASAAVRAEVADTFNAALADPEIAEQVATGTVVRAIRWAGFSPGIGTALPPGTAQPTGPSARPAVTPAPPQRAAGGTTRGSPTDDSPTNGSPAGSRQADSRPADCGPARRIV